MFGNECTYAYRSTQRNGFPGSQALDKIGVSASAHAEVGRTHARPMQKILDFVVKLCFHSYVLYTTVYGVKAPIVVVQNIFYGVNKCL
jgi:hypothetical protein